MVCQECIYLKLRVLESQNDYLWCCEQQPQRMASEIIDLQERCPFQNNSKLLTSFN